MGARTLVPLALTLMSAAHGAGAQEGKDDFKDYLIDVGPGHVSAGEMLKLSDSAITTIQAPKDFVALLNAAQSDDKKSGFGLAITPARTSLTPLSINSYTKHTWARVWGGTTFSYARNINPLAGVDYKQDAFAVNISHYIKAEDDPHVAAYRAFVDCKPLQQLVTDESSRVLLALKGVPPEEIQNALALAKRGSSFLASADAAAKQCARAAAEPLWNASQVALTLGQSWIRSPGAGTSRVSLARTVALSAAYGPSDQTLVDFTLRRTDRALDLDTIATSPVHKKTNIAALRLTYGRGDARDTYGLVEVSNVKSSRATLPDAAFKYALGIDKRLMEGVWLEFRVGKRRALEDGRQETVGLINLKFSTTTTLPKAQPRL